MGNNYFQNKVALMISESAIGMTDDKEDAAEFVRQAWEREETVEMRIGYDKEQFLKIQQGILLLDSFVSSKGPEMVFPGRQCDCNLVERRPGKREVVEFILAHKKKTTDTDG